MCKSTIENFFNHEKLLDFDSDECKEYGFLQELPILLGESIDAWSFYRSYLYKEYLVSQNEASELDEFIEFCNNTDNLKLIKIIEHYEVDKEIENFSRKMRNIKQIEKHNHDDINPLTCFLYQSYYEVETILKFLTSIIELKNNNQIDLKLSKFRDAAGNLKKGMCVNYIKKNIPFETEFYKSFNSGYNIKLRNSIGHNDYNIKNKNLVSNDGKISISQPDFFESLSNIQKLNNFLIYYFSNVKKGAKSLSKSGILGIGFNIKNEIKSIIIYQLKCFNQIDPCKKWLNNITFSIMSKQIETNIAKNVKLTGTLNKNMEKWLSLTEKQKALTVYFQSLLPHKTLNKNLFKTDIGNFGLEDSKIEVKTNFKIITSNQQANNSADN